jgi:hypothetical protein
MGRCEPELETMLPGVSTPVLSAAGRPVALASVWVRAAVFNASASPRYGARERPARSAAGELALA